MKKKIEVSKHILVPKHVKVTEKEKKELFDRYNISLRELPKILKKDPAIKHLGLKQGDVVKIIRKGSSAGESVFYRGVVNA